jgi:ubiquinone/menaquinone biosynthesis C-methylase UbiE
MAGIREPRGRTRKAARSGRRWVAALALLTSVAAAAAAQTRHPLTGRIYAGVMGSAGADWLDRPERESEEAPDKALALIGIPPGSVVADVGAGSGYFTVRLARLVGESGKVFANDIQPEMLARLAERVRAERLANVVTVLGDEANPRLPAGSCDLVLLVDVYHEFSEPQQMLRGLREALKRDGRLVLLEYRKEDPKVPIRFEHKMSVSEAKTEVEAEGFRLERAIEELPRQHILVFRRR